MSLDLLLLAVAHEETAATVEASTTSSSDLTSAQWRGKIDHVKANNTVYGINRKTANMFPTCNERTLARRVVSNYDSVTRHGPDPHLGFNLEAVLAEHAKQMAALGFPLTKDSLGAKAKELQVKAGGQAVVGGHSWMDGFLTRFPSLAVKRSEGLEGSRLNSVSREAIDRYFDLLKVVVKDVEPENIYIMDETNIMMGSDNVPVRAFSFHHVCMQVNLSAPFSPQHVPRLYSYLIMCR